MTSGYWNPTRRILDNGALSQLPELVASFEPNRILVVLGSSSFRNSIYYQPFKEALSGFSIQESVPAETSPTVAFVEQMRDSLSSERFDLVIGVGGGSVIDCAKALRILLNHRRGTLEEFLENKRPFEHKGLPFIAIPTTAGTGSEVTQYASLKTSANRKVSLTHPWLFPEAALVDPLLTHSMPPYRTACVGLDALSQAIESFWSVHHSHLSEPHSVRAIPLILENLEKAFREPGNRDARFAMSLASLEAGLAIAQTRTTAVHAVSYPLTTLFGIAHGHACALTLASFIRYNGPVLDPHRAATLWKTMGGSSWEEAAQTVERLMESVGLKRSLRQLGLDQSSLAAVLASGFRSDRIGNNPREVTQEALRDILQGIY